MLSKAKSRLITSGKKIFLIFNFSFLVFDYSFAQAPDWLWANAAGDTSTDAGLSIAVDSFGNVYTTGTFSGTVDFDPGPRVFNLISVAGNDIFISKLDSMGNFLWAKALGGMGYDEGYSITLDAAGNVYTTGVFAGTADFDPGAGVFNLTSSGGDEIFVSKLDSSGNFVWAKKMGGPSTDKGWSIVTDATGKVYTTGFFTGIADFDPGPGIFNLTSNGLTDIFISKLDSSGNFIWAKAMGGTSTDNAYSITLDSYGNVYTTGTFRNTVDFDPGMGVFNLISSGPADSYISKLDTSGNFIWAKAISGTGYSTSQSITTDASGNVYTTGHFDGTTDFDPNTGIFNLTSNGYDIFILRLDSSGNFVWAKAMGGTGNEGCYSIAVDEYANVYTSGFFVATTDFDPNTGVYNLTSAGGADIFISKLDSSGNFIWAKATGGTDNDCGRCLALDASRKVHLTGFFLSPVISFSPFTLTNAGTGNEDIFIAKLDTGAIITGSNHELKNSVNDFLFSPNPFASQATITFNKKVYDATFSLYNLFGEKVAETSGINGKNYQLNRGNLQSGVYVFEVVEKDKSIVRGKAVVY